MADVHSEFPAEKVGRGPGFYAFALVLIWAPLPLGSNRVWALALLAILLGNLLAACIAADVYRGRPVFDRLRPVLLPVALFLAYATVLITQQSHAFGEITLSADVFQTKVTLLATFVYFSGFLLTVLLAGKNRRQLRGLAYAFVLSGLLQAVLAIMLHAAKAEYSLFHFQLSHVHRAHGSFSYHNSLANYLLLGLSLGVGLMIWLTTSGAAAEGVGWKRSLQGALRFLLSRAMLLRLILVVMVIALVLTRSRMGNAVFMTALPALGLMGMLVSVRLRRALPWLVASMLVIDLAVLGQWIGMERVVERLQETALSRDDGGAEESLEARSGPAHYAIEMVFKRPWLGFGGGSFYTTYPAFNGPEYRQYYDHAHNDFVEIAADTGLIGFGLLALMVLATLLRTSRVLHRPASSLDGGLAFGVLLGVICVLVQATVDFHFQIPANALGFVVVLGLAWCLRIEAKPREY